MIMMKVTFLLLLVSYNIITLLHVVLLPTIVNGFSTPSPLITGGITKEHIIKSGGGVPVVPSGDNSLFDPNEQGKLGDTDNCKQRIQQGSTYQFLAPKAATTASSSSTSTTTAATTTISSTAPPNVELKQAQHWLLEDIDSDIPLNYAKPQAPAIATVLGRQRIITNDAPGDIQHIIMQLPDGMHYVEGQSISVIPPGTTKKGKKHKPRLYSIASTRYGDLLDGNTVSLCVRRAEYYDPTTGTIDPTKAGICSNFLCNAEPGTQVQVAGPIGKTMLLPQDPNTDIIMVATGTGIAPFRGFLHRLFMEQTVARHLFTGTAWLILGVPVSGGLLYPEEFTAMEHNSKQAGTAGNLEVTYAISREMTNQRGTKYYVQDVLAERADELFERLNNGAHIYFCGLKGMMPGILDALEQVAASKGVVWSMKLKELKANDQWHVEVY